MNLWWTIVVIPLFFLVIVKVGTKVKNPGVKPWFVKIAYWLSRKKKTSLGWRMVWWILFLFVALPFVIIIAPVVEEYIFRGALLLNQEFSIGDRIIIPTDIIPYYGKVNMLIIQALAFSSLHILNYSPRNWFTIDILRILGLIFFYGILLGLIAILFNSIVPTIIIHASVNLCVMLKVDFDKIPFFKSCT